MSGQAKRVSVLLPVHDPGELLEPLVSRILDEQTYPGDLIELVVVDDNSSDGAAERLRVARAGDERLVVRETDFGQVDMARNHARAGAGGELLAMTDHDCMPQTDWLERAVAEAADGRIVAGRIEMTAGERPSIWELLDMTYHLDQERYVREGNAATANVVVGADDFDRLGGLDEEQSSGGDFEFAQRAVRSGIDLRYAEDVIVRHPTRTTRAEYLAKAARVGKAEGRALRERSLKARAIMLVPGISTAIRCVKRRSLAVLSRERLAPYGIEPGFMRQAQALLVELFLVGPVLALGRWRGMR